MAIDLAQEARGVDTWTWLESLRRDGHGLIQIAQNDFSRYLDEARRKLWAADPAEPARPDPTPEVLLVHHDGYTLAPYESIGGGPQSPEQKQRELEERWRKAAMEQAEWEAASNRAQASESALQA